MAFRAKDAPQHESSTTVVHPLLMMNITAHFKRLNPHTRQTENTTIERTKRT